MLLGIRFDIGRALYSLLSQVRGVAGSDLLVLILAKCCSSTSSREYLELVVSFYSDYGIRSEAITAAITKLLDLCFEKEVITDGLLRKIANVDDLVLLTKLAKGRDGSAILIECGVPVRVVQAIVFPVEDPEILMSVLNFLLGIQRHFNVSPEVSHILLQNVRFFRHQLVRQFPFFADVTEVLLQALIVSNKSSVYDMYGQHVFELMQILIRYPFPRNCLQSVDIPGLPEEGNNDDICWWDNFSYQIEDSFSLPIPPFKSTGRDTQCDWTNAHYIMATASARILDLCACFLIKIYRFHSNHEIFMVNSMVLARGLSRFVSISHVLENYCIHLKQKLSVASLPSNGENEYEFECITELGPTISRFTERLITFLFLHITMSLRSGEPNTKEMMQVVKFALDHCRVEFIGVGFSSSFNKSTEKREEEKKQNTIPFGEFAKRMANILKELLDQYIPSNSRASVEKPGLIPRGKMVLIK